MTNRLQGIAKGLEFFQGFGGNAAGELVLLRRAGREGQVVLLVAQRQLAAEALGTHAGHAAAENGLLNGGIRRDDQGLPPPLPGVMGQAFDDLVRAAARGREDDLDAPEGLRVPGGVHIRAPVEDHHGLEFTAGVIGHIVQERLALAVEDVVGEVIAGQGPIAAAAAQDVVAVHDQEFSAGAGHLKELKGYEGKIFKIDARKISIEALGRYFPNTPMLAAIVKVSKVMTDEELLNDMKGSFKHKFAKKPEVIEGNMKALELALQSVEEV